MKKILILISIIFLTSGIESRASESIAVLDFKGKSVSSMEASVVTDFLRTALVNSRYFTVTERGNMEAILVEQGFQQTGCTTQECAVKVGNLLNVSKIVIGKVSKLGEKYYVTANLVDIATGQIVISERVRSETKDELVDNMDVLGKKIVEKSKGNNWEEEPDKSKDKKEEAKTKEKKSKKDESKLKKRFSLGIGVPIVAVNYHIGDAISLEIRGGSDEKDESTVSFGGVRVYLYFHRRDRFYFYLAPEFYSIDAEYGEMKANGSMVGVYFGPNIWLSNRIAFNVDFGISNISLKEKKFELEEKGIEGVVNLGMRVYLF
ncbi:MAG: hypothetical protein PF545_04735 [Elusimicrobia bacterium]|nr:hypothetical protein [Elusimicrobiota bacterium]